MFTIENLDEIRNKKGFICDMDGVIYHGNRLLPGVKEFVEWLYKEDKKFLFLTNSSDRSPRDLQQKLQRMGLDIDETHFYTSAQATARFLNSQSPGCSAYVMGEAGLMNALYEVGITMNDSTPDYVVIGEPKSYNYEMIIKAVKLIQNGAKLVATNSDLTGPTENGIIPACRAFVAPIELATGKSAYFVGKPNPHRDGHRHPGLLLRQTQPADDAHRAAPFGCAQRRGGNDWRPHGHRYCCRYGKRPGNGAGAQRRNHARKHAGVCLPPAPYFKRRR